MTAHTIQWQAPQPLWGRFGGTPSSGALADDQRRPAILRFASDDFMERMLATLARDPSRIDRLVARPESWRSPMKESADLIERTPIPLVAAQAKRTLFSRKPKSGVAPTAHEADDPGSQAQGKKLPLKLFQPAHQRFYLVTSSLVCGLPGLPERTVVPSGGEMVNFVIRRMLPAVQGEPGDREFAYMKDAQGARWQRVSTQDDDSQPMSGEELLPVFPLRSYHDDNARARTLWGGFVPVGRREEYISASVDRSAPQAYSEAQRQGLDIVEPTPRASKMARVAQFQADVAEPWKNLIRSSIKFATSESPAQPVSIGGNKEPVTPTGKRKRIFDFNLAQQNTSWLVLLDFADYLSAHLPDVWHAIASNGEGFGSLSPQRQDLYQRLATPSMPLALRNALKAADGDPEKRTPKSTLRDALKAIRAPGVREKLEAMQSSYTNAVASFDSTDWPPFHFILAGVDTSGASSGPYVALSALSTPVDQDFAPDPKVLADPKVSPDTAPEAGLVDGLTALVGRALVASTEAHAPPIPFALQMKNALMANVGDAGWFVIRFVHQRRDCGPLHLPTLSAPTQRFQLASFFDPDAPARPIRIALPMDTSPAGLRKFNKNTAFILSDMLCGQVQRAKGLGFVDLVLSVLPWPLHKDLDVGPGGPCSDGSLNIGMICSISIPIITICALIVLIIMISLLDFVFRWLPFFILCFPVPKLKGKS